MAHEEPLTGHFGSPCLVTTARWHHLVRPPQGLKGTGQSMVTLDISTKRTNCLKQTFISKHKGPVAACSVCMRTWQLSAHSATQGTLKRAQDRMTDVPQIASIRPLT